MICSFTHVTKQNIQKTEFKFWLQSSRKQSKPHSSVSTISLQIADCAEKMSVIIAELLFLANPLAQPIYVNLPSVSLWPLSPPEAYLFLQI